MTPPEFADLQVKQRYALKRRTAFEIDERAKEQRKYQ